MSAKYLPFLSLYLNMISLVLGKDKDKCTHDNDYDFLFHLSTVSEGHAVQFHLWHVKTKSLLLLKCCYFLTDKFCGCKSKCIIWQNDLPLFFIHYSGNIL